MNLFTLQDITELKNLEMEDQMEKDKFSTSLLEMSSAQDLISLKMISMAISTIPSVVGLMNFKKQENTNLQKKLIQAMQKKLLLLNKTVFSQGKAMM